MRAINWLKINVQIAFFSPVTRAEEISDAGVVGGPSHVGPL